MPTGAVTAVRIAYHCNDKADHVKINELSLDEFLNSDKPSQKI